MNASTENERLIQIANQKRGWRVSLSARFSLLVCGLILISLALSILIRAYLNFDGWLLIATVFCVILPLSLVMVKRYFESQLELFRTLSGTVNSYQDNDFSFGIHWQRNDELADLVDAHNQLGFALRQQRLNLVQRELLLDSMLQNTPVAMLLTSAGGHIVFANSTARQLLNDGRKLEGMLLGDILLHIASALRDALAHGGDGLFTVKMNKSGRVDDHFTGVDTDQNEHDDSAEEEIYHLSRRNFTLNGSEHELLMIRLLTVELRRQEVQTWKKVIRVISHELNNSLAPVASLARSGIALVERHQLERLPEILQTIEERALHLESFISGYARFAKLPSPRNELVEWTKFVARLQTQVRFQLVNSLPDVQIHFDLAQMEQALLNLLKNAHESGSPAEGVSLEVRRVLGAIKIEITDAGSGMNDDVMANALVPFYSTKRNGTGLGLALAREIVEAHGGRITLNNRKGGGLAVSLILPC
jgi:nitrogen fixation/metabolism regulation signal transduction histidine kinase